MCILLVTTAHPDYPLILLSNRDEFLSRPTAAAEWWEEDGKSVLSGRDLRHASHGTWLGLTKEGRIACLTNFREDSEGTNSTAEHQQSNSMGEATGAHPVAVQSKTAAGPTRSRGEITKAYLTSNLPPDAWAKRFFDEQTNGDWGDMGGFSLFFGQISPAASSIDQAPTVKLGVLSNRAKQACDVIWLVDDQQPEAKKRSKGIGTHAFTCSLSNSHFGDHAWPKVVKGEKLLADFVSEASKANYEREQLLDGAFDILSTDTMPKRSPNDDWNRYARQLRKSILIPPIEAGNDRYGTQKQTVIIVDNGGEICFEERTLFDDRGNEIAADEGKRQLKFKLTTPCSTDVVT